MPVEIPSNAKLNSGSAPLHQLYSSGKRQNHQSINFRQLIFEGTKKEEVRNFEGEGASPESLAAKATRRRKSAGTGMIGKWEERGATESFAKILFHSPHIICKLV